MSPKVAGIFLVASAASMTVAAAAAAPHQEVLGEVILPSGKALLVEVADTPEKRARGYMFRGKVGDDEGMIFLMGGLGFHAFWMKNCEVSLDIIWLDEAWKVVHIEKDVPPCPKDPCPSYSPMRSASHVLEVNSGGASRLGLKTGEHIIFIPPDRRRSSQ